MGVLKSASVLTLFLVLTSTVSTYATVPFRDHNTRIVNGFEAKPGQFPHQALLEIKTFTQSLLCGGSLLNNEWVITAAHCAISALNIKVSLGAQKWKEAAEPGRVIDTTTTKILHPQYNTFTGKNDLALIKLSRKISFTDRIQPILLPKSQDLFEGQDVIASGWGLKSFGDREPASELQWAPMHIISNEECMQTYSWIFIFDTTICSQGSKKESVCMGDSGGPLVVTSDNRTLIGVANFVHISGCNIGNPQGYARVTAYLKWIEEITGIASNEV